MEACNSSRGWTLNGRGHVHASSRAERQQKARFAKGQTDDENGGSAALTWAVDDKTEQKSWGTAASREAVDGKRTAKAVEIVPDAEGEWEGVGFCGSRWRNGRD